MEDNEKDLELEKFLENYDTWSEEENKKTEKMWKEIQERRKQEDELVSKMTDEERLKYLEEKYRRVNEQAKKYFTNIKTIEIEEDEE